MIVDDKGRLFKKINLIDLLIILIVIAAGIFVFGKYGKTKIVTPFTKQDKVVVTFYTEGTPTYSADAINVGDTASDKVTNSVFGKVIKKEVGPDMSYDRDSVGSVVRSPREGYCSITLTVEGTGIYSDSGVSVGNTDYYVYKYLELRAGKSYLYTRVENVEKK